LVIYLYSPTSFIFIAERCITKKDGNSIEGFLNSKTETVLILSLRVSNDILALLFFVISKSIFNYKSNPANRQKDNILLVLEEAQRYISTTKQTK
jgi:hypothetical protein